MPKTFSVRKFVLVDEKGEDGKPTGDKIRTLEVVAKELTWEQAKGIRKLTKGGQIFPEK